MNEITFVYVLTYLLIVSYTDILSGKIPNAVTYPFSIAGMTYMIFFPPTDILYRVAMLVFLFAMGYVLRKGMGYGDIKMLMTMSLYMSPLSVLLIFATANILLFAHACLTEPMEVRMSIMGMLGLVNNKNRIRKGFPLAPYMLCAFLIYSVYAVETGL
jgi:Flp pilus assembly protein protease CpaA